MGVMELQQLLQGHLISLVFMNNIYNRCSSCSSSIKSNFSLYCTTPGAVVLDMAAALHHTGKQAVLIIQRPQTIFKTHYPLKDLRAFLSFHCRNRSLHPPSPHFHLQRRIKLQNQRLAKPAGWKRIKSPTFLRCLNRQASVACLINDAILALATVMPSRVI